MFFTTQSYNRTRCGGQPWPRLERVCVASKRTGLPTVGNDTFGLRKMRFNCSQLRAAVRGRLGILRPRNGESVTLWVAKHVRGQGRGESTDFPKRR